MKNALLSLLILSLFSCAHTTKIREGVMHKTKRYVGLYITSTDTGGRFTFVRTTDMIIILKDNPTIPERALCYIRIEPCLHDLHPEIADQLSPRYFSWAGSEREYKVY